MIKQIYKRYEKIKVCMCIGLFILWPALNANEKGLWCTKSRALISRRCKNAFKPKFSFCYKSIYVYFIYLFFFLYIYLIENFELIIGDYFDIVAGVLQGDTLAPYLFIICLDYVLRTSIDKIKENGYKLTKERSRGYPKRTITDANYADDIALLANAHAQAETLLHSLERAAAGISLNVNAHKTENMCFN